MLVRKNWLIKKAFLILLGLFLTGVMYGQQLADGDTLYYGEFIKKVKQNHPVAKRADILVDRADARFMTSRGAFDPKLFAKTSEKNYKNKDYYSYGQAGVSVKSIYGVNFKGGLDYSDTTASYYSNETTTGPRGTGFLGVSVPLGKDLIFNQERASWKQADNAREMSAYQRLLLQNSLLEMASAQYFDWALSYYRMNTAKEAMQTAKEIKQVVMRLFTSGEAAAMDTMEADIQMRAAEAESEYYESSYRKNRELLRDYLWFEDGERPDPEDVFLPEQTPELLEELKKLIPEAAGPEMIERHPALMNYRIKKNNYEIQRKVNLMNMLPELRADYALLYDGYRPNNLDADNHKIGVSFSFPLFLRKERGYYKENELKIDDIDFKILDKENELMNKQKAYFEQLNVLENVLQKQRELTDGYAQLLSNENRRFESGESTMFVVTTRQQKLLTAKLKYIDSQSRWFSSWLKLVQSTGRLQEILE